MKAAPKWAQDLTINALLWWESQGNNPAIPELVWRHGSRRSSSGTAWTKSKRIVITAGRDRTDQKFVLLHEIAHTLTPENAHHSDRFWDIAWALYRWAKLPIRYCVNREKTYKIGAMVSYRRTQ